jgi:hypothetical protein
MAAIMNIRTIRSLNSMVTFCPFIGGKRSAARARDADGRVTARRPDAVQFGPFG